MTNFIKISVNGEESRAYIDLGSSCTTVTLEEAQRLNLNYDQGKKSVLVGFGSGRVTTLGVTTVTLIIDNVTADVEVLIVPNTAQEVPFLVGQTFTEQPGILIVKNNTTLKFVMETNTRITPDLTKTDADINQNKRILRVARSFIIPSNHVGHVPIRTESTGEVYVESSLRTKPRQESYVLPVVLRITREATAVLPILNLSTQDIHFTKDEIVARARTCEESKTPRGRVLRVAKSQLTQLNEDEVKVGPITAEEKDELMALLQSYRDCFALSVEELGCAKTASMDITLNTNQPFSYRPYRMARSEQDTVNEIVNELLSTGIVRESNSDYSSPVLLVKKKNGQSRLCIDYRKLNSLTVKDNFPLPRIDEQVDRLHGGVYFSSLDFRSGYYQIPMAETSKNYTAFVTPTGQFEFNRVPFGLTNAPRVFQRFMNRLIKPLSDIASVYLDDVLLHAKTVQEGIEGLRRCFELLREEGVTLNLEKCKFLVTTVEFLGLEISNGSVRPGIDKIQAVEKFTEPKNDHQVRQFLGLTGYFRHFVADYGTTNSVTKKINCMEMD